MLLIFSYSTSAIPACSMAYLSEFHNAKNRTKYLSTTALFTSIGLLWHPVQAWFILPQQFKLTIFDGLTFTSWRLFLVLSSTVPLFSLTIISFLPESPKFLLATRRKDEALQVLKQINRINNGPEVIKFKQII